MQIENELEEETGCKLSSVIATRKERPCPMYQDLIFEKINMPLHTILFRNYYIAWISIFQRQRHENTLCWIPVLKNERLMVDPHCEEDARAWHELEVSSFEASFDNSLINRKTSSFSTKEEEDPPLGTLRIMIMQPSPMWPSFEIQDLKCFSTNAP
mmetsp:Transcript_22686/g.29376  ORF Transcript_22686/g.29376 Transcript_22686/m.29376 type:complete len:156 (-) Transcript_22686:162-629(-)